MVVVSGIYSGFKLLFSRLYKLDNTKGGWQGCVTIVLFHSISDVRRCVGYNFSDFSLHGSI